MKNDQGSFLKWILGTVLTVIITLIIKDIVWPRLFPINRINAKGYFSSYSLPQNLGDYLKNFNNNFSYSRINSQFPELSNYQIGSNSGSLAVSEFIDSSLPIDLRYDLENITSYWKIKIENMGNNQIENLSLNFPNNGFYSMKSRENDIFGTYKNIIKVGTINPKETILLNIWSDKVVSSDVEVPFEHLYAKDIYLTNANGVYYIDFATKEYGFVSLLMNNLYTIMSFVFILISLSGLLISVFLTKTQRETN